MSFTHFKQAAGTLITGTSWMMVAEFLARISRVVTLIAFAAFLSPTEYGIAMLALVSHELLRVLSRTGVGAKVIQCEEHELSAYVSNAITLQWGVCILLMVIQVLSAQWIAAFYEQALLTDLLMLMALSHLLYPLVTVRVFLVQRQGNMKFYGIASGFSIAADNLSTALLLALDFGLMSVAYAKIIAAICWVVFFSAAKVERYRAAFSTQYMPRLMKFSGMVLCSELLKCLRLQADVLLAGRFLSPELFGLYSFAKSSGVGLSQSISNGFIASLYPYLSKAWRQATFSQAKLYSLLGGACLSSLFIVQAMLAPFYIELLFGGEWLVAIELVSLLCISAIGLLMLDVTNTLLRISQSLTLEIVLSLLSVVFLVAGLLFLQPEDALTMAQVVLTISLLWLPLCIAAMAYQSFSSHSLKRFCKPSSTSKELVS